MHIIVVVVARRRCSPRVRTTSLPGSQPLHDECPEGLRDRHSPSGHVREHTPTRALRTGAPLGDLIRPPRKAESNRASGLSNHDHRPQVDGQPIRTRRPPHGTQVHMHRPLPCLDTNPAPMGNILREETVSPVTRSKDVCDAITRITSCRGHKTKRASRINR